MRSLTLAATLFLLPLGIANAQRVERGDVVRFVFTPDDRVHEGSLSHLTADSLFLDDCFRCKPLAYAKSEALGLETYRGSTRPRNALLGFVGGVLLAGLVIGIQEATNTCQGELCGFKAIGYSYEVLGGSLLGLLVGIALGKETWEPVEWPRGSR